MLLNCACILSKYYVPWLQSTSSDIVMSTGLALLNGNRKHDCLRLEILLMAAIQIPNLKSAWFVKDDLDVLSLVRNSKQEFSRKLLDDVELHEIAGSRGCALSGTRKAQENHSIISWYIARLPLQQHSMGDKESTAQGMHCRVQG